MNKEKSVKKRSLFFCCLTCLVLLLLSSFMKVLGDNFSVFFSFFNNTQPLIASFFVLIPWWIGIFASGILIVKEFYPDKQITLTINLVFFFFIVILYPLILISASFLLRYFNQQL